MGYYFHRTSGPLKMGVARAGRRAKHAAHVYTRRKKLKGHPATFLSLFLILQNFSPGKLRMKSFPWTTIRDSTL